MIDGNVDKGKETDEKKNLRIYHTCDVKRLDIFILNSDSGWPFKKLACRGFSLEQLRV